MKESIENINQFLKGTYSCDSFISDKILCHAVIYNLQCIGESVYKLSKDFRKSHTDMDWDAILRCVSTISAIFLVLICGVKQASAQNIKPEFSISGIVGFVKSASLTAGISFNDTRVATIGIGTLSQYQDSQPATEHDRIFFLGYRRYFGKATVSVYNDLRFGLAYCYKSDTQNSDLLKKGQTDFYFSWCPGVRFKLYKGLSFTLGPCFEYGGLGFHVGLTLARF